MSVDQIAAEALRLSAKERALLAGSLRESQEVKSAATAEMEDAAIMALALERDMEIESGQVQAVPHKIMTMIQAEVPDYLAKLASEAAEKEKTTLDQIVALTLSAQLSVWKVREDMETRASRGRPEDIRDVLASVPDVPPLPGDELWRTISVGARGDDVQAATMIIWLSES